MNQLNKMSFSKMTTYEECPYRYYLIYEKEIKGEKSIYAEFGTACHEALEQYCKCKDLEKNKLILHFTNSLKKQEEIAKKRAYGMFYKQGLKLLYEFPINEIIHDETIDIEYQFELNFENGVKLNGYIDRIKKIQDGIEIIDYKTGQIYEEKHLRQIIFYGNAIAKIFKPLNIQGTLHYLKFGKKTYNLNQNQFDIIEKDIRKVITNIRTGIFERIINEKNCKYCGVSNECRR